MSENYRNKTVCDYAMTVRCDWQLRQPCCVMHAHTNTAIQLNTCTKLVLNILSVLSKLISIYATMQCNEIAIHINIFKWRCKKNIESQVNISLKSCSIFFYCHPITLVFVHFFSNDQVAQGGEAKCPPPVPPLVRPCQSVYAVNSHKIL